MQPTALGRSHCALFLLNPTPPGRPLPTTMLQGKLIKAAKAEALIRKVMHSTPPGLFQHMMRTINSQVG